MHLQCVRCPKLGKECDGPKFVSMSPQELVAWCKERKKHMGLTNEKLAEMSGMSKGTIDGFLANSHPDFKFSTVRPLLQVLVGGRWKDDPCPVQEAESVAVERVRQLETEIRYKEETIHHYEEQIASMKTLIANTNARHTNSQNFLREQIRGRNKAVAILSVLLGICLLVIIGALIVDRINPDKGFFWLDTVTSWLTTGNMFRGNV